MDGKTGNIFVISDLHIGDGGVRDNFESGKRTPQLRAFLDHVGGEGGELVILGDLFAGFGRMLSIFAGIFEDAYGSPLVGSGERVADVLEQFGESMLTIWKSALATVQTQVGKKDVCPTAALTPAQNPDRLDEHVLGVRADLEKGHYDVAVLGHTHKPGRIGDWYYNSGSWTGPLNSFLRISPEGHVRYFDWKGGRATEHQTPVIRQDTTPERAAAVAKNPIQGAIAAATTLFPRPTKPERSRWLLLLQGALALSLGVYTLTVSVGQGSSAGWHVLVTAFGAYALLDGAISVLGAPRERALKRLLSRARGVASILLGLVVLRRGYVVEIFQVLFGVWAFLSGAPRIAASVAFKNMVDSRWLFLVGAGSMLAGLVLLLWPMSAWLLKLVLSGYLCYYGAGEVMAGVFGQRLPKPPASGLSPVSS